MVSLHKFGSLKLAGQLMVVNAAIHAIAPFVSGFSSESLLFLGVALLYGAAGWALLQEIRWVAYPVFIMTAFGCVYAYASTGASTIPDFILWPLVVIDVAVAVTLFVHIWRRTSTRA